MDQERLEGLEWLEADGRGGFACGTVATRRTRRYHGLLLTATTPPAGRVLLVNGMDVWVHTPAGSSPLASPGRPGASGSATGPRSSTRSSSAAVRRPSCALGG